MKYVNKVSEKDKIIADLDNKRFDDISENFQNFVRYIFKDIKNQDVINCKKHNGTKIDFTLCVNSVEKNIAIKKGKIVCIHKERIYNLLNFLLSIKVSKECIFSLLGYHFGDGTFDGSGEVKSYGELLKEDYQKQISIVNNEFKNKDLLSKVIDYVLIQEKSGKEVDYFYHGDSRKGVFAKASDVKINLLEEENNYPHNFMRIGVMNFSPLKRSYYFSEAGEQHKYTYVLKLNIKRYLKKREN